MPDEQRDKLILTILGLAVLSMGSGCVSPDAIQAKLGVIEQRLEQKADNRVVADEIGRVENKIEQTTQIAETLWKKSIQAETINYGGAGWVVLTAVAFIIAVGLFVTWLFKKILNYKGMLSLVTTAVHRSEPEVRKAIKDKINQQALNDRSCCAQHKEQLSKECKKMGVFARDG